MFDWISINETNQDFSVNNLKISTKGPAFTLTSVGQKGTAEKAN